MSAAQSVTLVESLLAQQKAAFGPDSLDAAAKRLESAAKLTGICMHTISDILCCEIEMMTSGSRHLAAVTESLLAQPDPEQAPAKPAETVKLAVEETIQEMRHLNDLMRAGSFEIYDAFVSALMPVAMPKEATHPVAQKTKRLEAAA